MGSLQRHRAVIAPPAVGAQGAQRLHENARQVVVIEDQPQHWGINLGTLLCFVQSKATSLVRPALAMAAPGSLLTPFAAGCDLPISGGLHGLRPFRRGLHRSFGLRCGLLRLSRGSRLNSGPHCL